MKRLALCPQQRRVRVIVQGKEVLQWTNEVCMHWHFGTRVFRMAGWERHVSSTVAPLLEAVKVSRRCASLWQFRCAARWCTVFDDFSKAEFYERTCWRCRHWQKLCPRKCCIIGVPRCFSRCFCDLCDMILMLCATYNNVLGNLWATPCGSRRFGANFACSCILQWSFVCTRAKCLFAWRGAQCVVILFAREGRTSPSRDFCSA